MTKNIKDLSYFHNHLVNGLDFCRNAYGLFEDIRKAPDGIERLRLRKGKLEKKLIEELLPLARYIQARYSHGRQIKIRWIDGKQNYDARLLSAGFLVVNRFVPRRQYVEVTTAVHEKDHISRRLSNDGKPVFGVKGIQKDPETGEYISQPYVYTNNELLEDLSKKILGRTRAKSKISYPKGTVLIIQCFLDTLFFESEWSEAMQMVDNGMLIHPFSEIFVFDSNHHYSYTFYERTRNKEQ